MKFADHNHAFGQWLDRHMVKGQQNVPARLVTLVALLERLRAHPVLDTTQHLAESGVQLIEHDSFVGVALSRFNVESPVRARGRRANNLGAWAQPLFDWLRACDFSNATENDRALFLTEAQETAIQRLIVINDDKPLIVRYSKGTAVTILSDLLDQAQRKKRAKDVAEYLVGAKLELRFGLGAVRPRNVNTPSLGQLADFRIGNTAIEITTLERADKAHCDQIESILTDTGPEVWLLTRLRDREKWLIGLEPILGPRIARVVVGDVETFVGQNLSEMGKFRGPDVKSSLSRLIDRYHEVWLPKVGSGGIRIVSRETGE